MRFQRQTWWLSVVFALAICASQVEAQQASEPPTVELERTRAAAREAFLQGVIAAHAGRWEDARREFERPHDLVPSAVTLLNLAGSQVNTGRLVQGYENYLRILRTPADAAAHRELIEQVVNELESRIPKVRIVAASEEADALLLDGQSVA